MRRISDNPVVRLVLKWPNHLFAIATMLVIAASFCPAFLVGGSRTGSSAFSEATPKNLEEAGFASALDKARSAEALFYAEPNAENALSLSYALLRAGDYRGLADFLRQENDFPLDENARAIFRSETDLRLQNFVGAFEASDALVKATPEHAEARYIRARARYAMIGAMDESVRSDLLFVIQNSESLAPAAWVFRTRIALDENDTAQANSALNRASELGVAPLTIEALSIEIALRGGDFEVAQRKLSERRWELSKNRFGVDVEGERLAAMLELALNDPLSASARLDRISFWLTSQNRGDLLRAVAKFDAGDISQGRRLLNEYGANAPNDWAVRGLYKLYLGSNGDVDVLNQGNREAFIEEVERALLSNDRDSVVRIIELLPDTALTVKEIRSARASIAGMRTDEQIKTQSHMKQLFELEAEARSDKRYRPKGPTNYIERNNGPITQYFAAKVALKANNVDQAIALFDSAVSNATDFFAPVKQLSIHFSKRGRYVAGEDLLAAYLRRNPERSDARVWFAFYLADAGKQNASTSIFGGMTVEELFSDVTAVKAYGLALEPSSQTLEALIESARRKIPGSKTLGHLLVHSMDNQAAAKAFLSSIAANPKDTEARRGYLLAMTSLGRGELARNVLLRLDEKDRRKVESQGISNQVAIDG